MMADFMRSVTRDAGLRWSAAIFWKDLVHVFHERYFMDTSREGWIIRHVNDNVAA